MGEMGDATSAIEDDAASAPKVYATQAELKASVDILKQECEDTWREIAGIQRQLKERSGEPTHSAESSLVSVYQAKASLLKAQTDVIKQTQPQFTPSNDIIQFEIIKQELQNSVSQLQETLTLVRSERKELDIVKAQEELFKEEKGQVKEVLETKLSECETELAAEGNVESRAVLKDVEAKTAKMKKYCRGLMKKMAAFIQEHFPEPSEEQIQKWRSKHKQSSAAVSSIDTGTPFLSLQTIIEQLMNLIIDSPNDCYLEITDAFWPPYLELLLRSGIVLRNPERDNYIRLMPFHM